MLPLAPILLGNLDGICRPTARVTMSLSINQPPLAREKAIDFGCGTGTSTQLLNEKSGFHRVYGLDVSPVSLSIARERFHNPLLVFQKIEDYSLLEDADLIFSNGVYHHTPTPKAL